MEEKIRKMILEDMGFKGIEIDHLHPGEAINFEIIRRGLKPEKWRILRQDDKVILERLEGEVWRIIASFKAGNHPINRETFVFALNLFLLMLSEMAIGAVDEISTPAWRVK